MDGYKIPSNSDSYAMIKPKQIYKPSPNTHGKTNKMQMNNTDMEKGDIVSIKLSLCCYCGVGDRAGGGGGGEGGAGLATQPAHLLLGPLDSTRAQGSDVTALGLTNSIICISGSLCFFSLVRDNSNSGPWHQCHGKHCHRPPQCVAQ